LFLTPLLSASAQDKPQPKSDDKTSTPEERATWPVITHKLEADPLDPDLQKQGQHAVTRIIDVNDFHVPICGGLFKDFTDHSYEFSTQIARQYFLATASYLVEHNIDGADKKLDTYALQFSAAESALKVYAYLLHQNPKSHSEELDDLLKKQSQGKLPDAVSKACKVKPR
jgi:hypothetical protein